MKTKEFMKELNAKSATELATDLEAAKKELEEAGATVTLK